MKKFFSVRMLIVILGLFVSLQIPFTVVLGSATRFSLFDFAAPALGTMLGPVASIVSVLAAELLNFTVNGKTFTDPANIIRLFPSLFAVFYFSKKRFSDLFVPAVCILAFIAHPVGKQSWAYSMFWLIPMFAHYKRDNIFLRSLGATFTAHAVGGALWIWFFGLTPQIWIALIPQVILERTFFAAGITVSYLVIKKLSIAVMPKLGFLIHL